MANPAVTYTFTNGTTADASQVNQNFTDLINGLTDSTKSLTIAGVTFTTGTGTNLILSVGTSTDAIALTQSGTGAGINLTVSGSSNGILITYSGVLGAGTAALNITASGAETTGSAIAQITSSNGSSTIPVIKLKNASGGDFLSCQDNSSNVLAQLTSAGVLQSIGSLNSGWVSNLSIKYASNALQIVGGDGSAISSTNPAWITMMNSAAGGTTCVPFKITSAPSFQDHAGTSAITGNTFGITAGTAWAQDIPFYLYAVSVNGTGVTFAISRNPCARLSPASGNAKAGGTGAATENSFFFIDSSITVATYSNTACMCIGSFRMRADTTPDWSVQTFNYADGINQFHEQTPFTMPTGQNGATSGKYFINGSSTAPTFSTNSYIYYVRRNGFILVCINFVNSSSGAGGSNLRMTLPTISVASGNGFDNFGGVISTEVATTATQFITMNFSPGTTSIFFWNTTAGNLLLNSNYSALAAAYISGNFIYKAFLET